MYDRAFFDRPIDRRGTACEKWDVAMARDARVSNPMWVADMDFRCPDEVVNALCERAAIRSMVIPNRRTGRWQPCWISWSAAMGSS